MVWHGQSFALQRRQARALLFRLAVELEPVSREVLADLLWPERVPAKARRSLTRLLSYIRQALPQGELLLVKNAAVTLDPARVTSDAARFAALCGADKPEGWAAAVDLYRGSFLEGFTLADNWQFDDWVGQNQRRFERLYLETLRKLIADRAAERAYAQAIRFGQRYLAADDLAEDVHRQLIKLYARTGRREAALRQYEQCVVVLERELGVPPLPETRAAYEAARDGALQPASTTPPPKPLWATLPGLDLPLIGRESAWSRLESAHRRFKGGGAVLISGEPGVGKSRLMQEFATAQSGLVLAGNCHEGGRDLPYQPLVQALRLALPDRERWRQTRPIWLAEAARLIPELRAEIPGLPQPVEVEPAQAQARLFEALTQVFQALAAGGPLLLCLDDVHWADAATLGWLSYLARMMAGSGICVLATFRAHLAEDVSDWRGALERRRLAADIRLENLSREAVAELLQQVSRTVQAPDGLADRLHAATGGNAFFVLETLRELRESGRLGDETADLPLPKTVRETVLRRAGRLSALAGQLLEMASVLAPLVSIETLAAAAGREEMAVAEGLEELLARHLLLAGDKGFAFQHDLAREALYQNIPSWRGRLLHRRAAKALTGAPGGEREGILGHIARHFEAAGELAEAVDYYRQAAEADQRIYAHEEAIAHLRRALACLTGGPESAPLAGRLQESLGHSLAASGRYPEAREAFSSALAMSDVRKGVRSAALQREIGKSFMAQHRIEEASAALNEALDSLGSEERMPRRAWQQVWLELQLTRMELFYFQSRLDDMSRLIDLVKPTLDEVGEVRHQADYLSRQGELVIRQERYALSKKGTDLARAFLKVAQHLGQPDKLAYARFTIGFRHLWSGNPVSAVEALQIALRLAEEIGLAHNQCLCLTYLACAYRLQNNVNETRSFAERALALASQLDIFNYIAAAEANLAWSDWRDGKLDEAETRARQALARWGDYPYPFMWLAHWPLLAMAAAQEEWAKAINSAEAMIDLRQQKLPDNMTAALSQAVESWKGGLPAAAESNLNKALKLAQESGLL